MEKLARTVRVILYLLISMFLLNITLALFIVHQFRRLPGVEVGERLERAELAQINLLQGLEFERAMRKRNSDNIDAIRKHLEERKGDGR